MSHTIVMMQPGGPSTRTYSDYDTVKEAMDGELSVRQVRNMGD